MSFLIIKLIGDNKEAALVTTKLEFLKAIQKSHISFNISLIFRFVLFPKERENLRS